MRTRAVRSLAGGLLLAVAAGWCGAVRADELQFEAPPSALTCLTSTTGTGAQPSYPPDALAAQQAAVVRVRLRFEAPDKAPAVEVAYNNGGDAFERAVRGFVADYRLPCLPAAAPAVEATQEFQFVAPVVHWHPVRAPADAPRAASPVSAECLRSVRGAGVPVYPPDAVQRGDTGTLLVRLKFVSADAAPEVTFVYDADSKPLARAVRQVVERYRLPCLAPDQLPLTAQQRFSFQFQGQQANRLKPAITITDLAALIRDLKAQHVRFDFATMGCPFELAFQPFQPYAPNRVGEVGARDANRRELLEWLAGVTLDIPKQAMRQVIGETTHVAVPCIVLDLL